MKLVSRLNKKFTQLDDKTWLKKERSFKAMDEIAKELGCSHGSVRWACRVFNEEEKKQFVWKRKPHTNFKL